MLVLQPCVLPAHPEAHPHTIPSPVAHIAPCAPPFPAGWQQATPGRQGSLCASTTATGTGLCGTVLRRSPCRQCMMQSSWRVVAARRTTTQASGLRRRQTTSRAGARARGRRGSGWDAVPCCLSPANLVTRRHIKRKRLVCWQSKLCRTELARSCQCVTVVDWDARLVVPMVVFSFSF
jgi:hypothetical protein